MLILLIFRSLYIRNKSACCRVIISRPQINSSRFLVVVFTTVTECICVIFIDVFLNAESVILVSLSHFTIGICKIYNIAVSVLGIVGILGFIAVFVIVLSNKVCSSYVAISFIELVIDNICNNLLASVPNVVDCFIANIIIS